jgi:GTP-binding protein
VQTDVLPLSYKRYLTNYYREKLGLSGTPIRIEFKSPVNPFEGQKKAKPVSKEIDKKQRLQARNRTKLQK